MGTKKNDIVDLPNFVKAQLEIINNLQKRVNQLNEDFEIEKNCKNQVYFFILEKGYFDEYVEYNKEKPVK
ncbi:hypothetical protein DK150_370072 [Flavobacterium psychrophilum]|uniref:hypothetical protein n=1 Tax=Flavobacterium psychrophilum TaxID=96345 RepID=UPI000B7C344F|nr:hypothetical protein [Flavobacterium psychrophilum]SNA76262.1 hypothetical protein DK150_370072 [Flavobacterium psychrophilum]